ncbi:zinc finger protein 90 [Trichonephila clavipes]|nr:zinc finger protein 90 [Trichonephila clavipes]
MHSGFFRKCAEFAARINKLGTQIFQSSNSVLTTAARNANDQLLQFRFISGLRNDIRKFVLARDPNTLEESINAALIEEQNLELNEIASKTSAPVCQRHRKAECRKRIADQRTWNSPRFRRSVSDETPVSRSSRIQPVNHRRVRFEDSIPRRFPPVSQRNSRDMGNAGGFRQNRRNEILNFRGESFGKVLTYSEINIDPQINDTIVNIRNDSDSIVTLNKDMKIITVNNYEDFLCDFLVSQDILPPSEKDFSLSGFSKMKKRLFQLLISHKSAFARSTVELSAAATEYHRIHLQHDYPLKCPIYKIPFNLRNEFRRQIADLEKAGIISKSKSQYNTPVLFVKQKEKWRLVLNFRKLNEITLTQDFAIPTLDDILHEISGSY